MFNVRWILVATLAAGTLISAASQAADRPSFVFFLVDDMGYMDIGANNPDTFYETPNIDALAASGMRFTDGYAACPVCSPTRYSILSGKHPSRVDATNYFSGRRTARFAGADFIDHMPLSEQTLAESLQQAGYKTAFLGKWHLGPNEEFWPEHQGFDFNVGGHHRGMPRSYFSPYSNPRLKDGPKGEHLTARLTDEAISLIQQMKDEPFLLYMSYYTVHTPLQAPKELVEKYRRKAMNIDGEEFGDEEQVWPTDKPRKVRQLQKHATYAAMVETLDDSVGRILQTLEDLGLDENTVVCFTSDNGGLSTSEGSPTSNLPLRGGKGWLYEGGIREPFLIRWPGVTKAGQTSDEPVVSTDFYPTMLQMAGLDLKPQQHLDGHSLAPLLKDGTRPDREALYWHYPHYANQGGFPGAAVRMGRYKLIERFEDGRVQLYDLQNDIGEQNDLAEQMPERVQQMRERLHAWYDEVDARFLEPLKNGPEPWRP